jgi:hypothetical protein
LEDATDSDIFIISVVPLQLYSEKSSGHTDIIWQNRSPQFATVIPFRHSLRKKQLTQQKKKHQLLKE